MELTIFNTYVVMESQEQCDRMKQLCIDNNLPIWDIFNFYKTYDNIFGFIDNFDFWVTSSKENTIELKKEKTKVTEQEFINLLNKHNETSKTK